MSVRSRANMSTPSRLSAMIVTRSVGSAEEWLADSHVSKLEDWEGACNMAQTNSSSSTNVEEQDTWQEVHMLFTKRPSIMASARQAKMLWTTGAVPSRMQQTESISKGEMISLVRTNAEYLVTMKEGGSARRRARAARMPCSRVLAVVIMGLGRGRACGGQPRTIWSRKWTVEPSQPISGLAYRNRA